MVDGVALLAALFHGMNTAEGFGTERRGRTTSSTEEHPFYRDLCDLRWRGDRRGRPRTAVLRRAALQGLELDPEKVGAQYEAERVART